MRQFVMRILCSVWCAAIAFPVTAADPQLSPAITRDAVCLVQWNGKESWTAYKETASYQAFFESKLVPALINQVPQIAWQQLLTSMTPVMGIEEQGTEVSDLNNVLQPAWTNGGILALGSQVDEKASLPYAVLVVCGGANGYPTVNTLATRLMDGAVKEADVSGHKVLSCEIENQEAACWTEGDDLVFFFSFESSDKHAAVERLLSAAAADQLDKQPAWRGVWSEEPIPTDSFRLWMNLKGLLALGQQMAGCTDETGPLQQFLAFTGIDQWQTFAFGSGCHGKHLVHQWSLQAKQSPMQVIGWGEQTVSLDQLPPLPADVCSFSLQALDWKKAFQRLMELQSQIVADPEPVVSFLHDLGLSGVTLSLVKPENQDALRQQMETALSALEPMVCIYNDRKQQILPWGIPTLAVKVKDPAVLLAQLEKLGWKRDDRWGCPTFYNATEPVVGHVAATKSDDDDADHDDQSEQAGAIEANIAGNLKASLGTMTIAICDGWLVAGIQPQTVQTFVLRSQGKLPRWSPDRIVAETRAKLPATFARLAYDDPRAGIETLASLAPWLRDGMQTIVSAMVADTEGEINLVAATTGDVPGAVKVDLKRDIASPLDIPPVELVVAPLFPNISVTTVAGNITRERTYGSTFVQNPILWAVAGYFGLTVGANLF